ncbi:D-ribulokinase [Roseivivax sediminis]|uniref:D-ribulokinase n=1 Tax=Roseivivax sediminis TaxID=936889 RepID=A0A1I1WGI9_9RHOB|nr:FGGY family pentulose kinase [Roseivivax sediminis]SFD94121.1 D-ribulokinase [Roseivivax sediminis]
MNAYLGIDVGTGSARAGVVDESGRLLATAACDLELLRPGDDHAEYRSSGIWEAVGRASREALSLAGSVDIVGIGFDATCSLVVVGSGGVSTAVDPEIDTIAWLDHRAIPDAEAIDATGHDVLRHVGGSVSAEMQMPKLRWLHRTFPDRMREAEFFDLPDWLTFMATGSRTRSVCSAVCKWLYQAERGYAGEGWNPEFLSRIGLETLSRDGFAPIGRQFAPPGTAVGELAPEAAAHLGAPVGTKVSASLIDAYAGALGVLLAGKDADMDGRVSLIAGTSACHIALTQDPVFVPGVWGPYHGALLPGTWALEAGQSAAGALLDRLVEGHAASASAREAAERAGRSLYDRLAERIDRMAGKEGSHRLTERLHVQPDFLGNRAPLADPTRRGAISGLTLSMDEDDLARLYLAGIQALAHGTRQMLDTMRAKGVTVSALVVTGGWRGRLSMSANMPISAACP